jgi:four helix bundle protein
MSIPANIAEGCGRSGGPESTRVLYIGLGSASEAEYHLLLAHELGLLTPSDHKKLIARITEIKRMPTALILKLKADC